MERGLPIKQEITDTTQGLKQSQPGHRQQGVNLTLIVHTTPTQKRRVHCVRMYAVRMHSADKAGVLWDDVIKNRCYPFPLQVQKCAFDNQFFSIELIQSTKVFNNISKCLSESGIFPDSISI